MLASHIVFSSCKDNDDEWIKPAPIPEFTKEPSFCGDYIKDIKNAVGIASFELGGLDMWHISVMDENTYYYIFFAEVGGSWKRNLDYTKNHKVRFSGKIYKVKEGRPELDKRISEMPSVHVYVLRTDDTTFEFFDE